MKNRLDVARQLLSEDGVIFISIDDNEQAHLKVLCDEIFGRSSFVATIPRKTRSGRGNVPYNFSQDFDFILVYTKASRDDFVFKRKIRRKYYQSDDYDDRWRLNPMTVQATVKQRPNCDFTIINPKNGDSFPVNPNRTWAITKDTFPKYLKQNKIVFPGDYSFLKISKPMLRIFQSEDRQKKGQNWDKTFVSSDFLNQAMNGIATNYPNSQGTKEIIQACGSKVFSFPKPVGLIERIIEVATNKNDFVLDFFAGSGTTGEAVMRLNAKDGGSRRFVLIEQLQGHIDVCLKRLQQFLAKSTSKQSFIYAELAKLNQKLIDQINNRCDKVKLNQIKQNLAKKYFLNHDLKLIEFKQHANWSNLSLTDKKKMLIKTLDLNQIYLNLAEIDDVRYNVSTKDKALTQAFYN